MGWDPLPSLSCVCDPACVAPEDQYTSHAPVPPTAALGEQLVPELRRTVLAALPALPEIRPIWRKTTAVAHTAFARGEACPREPIAQGARWHPDLLCDDRPRVAFVP